MAFRYMVMYCFKICGSKSDWHVRIETADYLEAKAEAKRMKKHLGKDGGNVKIVTVEA